jgi:hypothetical protein
LLAKHFRKLLSDCPPDTMIAASVVVTEGVPTFFTLFLKSEVAEGGPSPEVLREGLDKVLRDYLNSCPNVFSQRASGDAPS